MNQRQLLSRVTSSSANHRPMTLSGWHARYVASWWGVTASNTPVRHDNVNRTSLHKLTVETELTSYVNYNLYRLICCQNLNKSVNKWLQFDELKHSLLTNRTLQQITCTTSEQKLHSYKLRLFCRCGMHNNVIGQYGSKAYVATNYFQTSKTL